MLQSNYFAQPGPAKPKGLRNEDLKKWTGADPKDFFDDEETAKSCLPPSSFTKEEIKRSLISNLKKPAITDAEKTAIYHRLYELQSQGEEETINQKFFAEWIAFLRGKVHPSSPEYVTISESPNMNIDPVNLRTGIPDGRWFIDEQPPVLRPGPEGDEIRAYLASFTKRHYNFMSKVIELKLRGPRTLKEHWLFFKYIVKGHAKDFGTRPMPDVFTNYFDDNQLYEGPLGYKNTKTKEYDQTGYSRAIQSGYDEDSLPHDTPGLREDQELKMEIYTADGRNRITRDITKYSWVYNVPWKETFAFTYVPYEKKKPKDFPDTVSEIPAETTLATEEEIEEEEQLGIYRHGHMDVPEKKKEDKEKSIFKAVADMGSAFFSSTTTTTSSSEKEVVAPKEKSSDLSKYEKYPLSLSPGTPDRPRIYTPKKAEAPKASKTTKTEEATAVSPVIAETKTTPSIASSPAPMLAPVKEPSAIERTSLGDLMDLVTEFESAKDAKERNLSDEEYEEAVHVLKLKTTDYLAALKDYGKTREQIDKIKKDNGMEIDDLYTESLILWFMSEAIAEKQLRLSDIQATFDKPDNLDPNLYDTIATVKTMQLLLTKYPHFMGGYDRIPKDPGHVLGSAKVIYKRIENMTQLGDEMKQVYTEIFGPVPYSVMAQGSVVTDLNKYQEEISKRPDSRKPSNPTFKALDSYEPGNHTQLQIKMATPGKEDLFVFPSIVEFIKYGRHITGIEYFLLRHPSRAGFHMNGVILGERTDENVYRTLLKAHAFTTDLFRQLDNLKPEYIEKLTDYERNQILNLINAAGKYRWKPEFEGLQATLNNMYNLRNKFKKQGEPLTPGPYLGETPPAMKDPKYMSEKESAEMEAFIKEQQKTREENRKERKELALIDELRSRGASKEQIEEELKKRREQKSKQTLENPSIL